MYLLIKYHFNAIMIRSYAPSRPLQGSKGHRNDVSSTQGEEPSEKQKPKHLFWSKTKTKMLRKGRKKLFARATNQGNELKRKDSRKSRGVFSC